MGIYFDRTAADFLVASGVPQGAPAVPFSWAAWCWTANSLNAKTIISIGDKDSATSYHALILQGSGAGQTVRASSHDGSTGNADTSASYPTSEWFHACGVHASGSSRKAYVNGGNVGSDNAPIAPAAPDRVILGSTADLTPLAYYQGIMAEVAIWDIALSEDQILALSYGARPLSVSGESIVAYWPLMHLSNLRDPIGDFNLTATGGATDESPPKGAMPVIEVPSFGSASGAALPWLYYEKRRKVG